MLYRIARLYGLLQKWSGERTLDVLASAELADVIAEQRNSRPGAYSNLHELFSGSRCGLDNES